VADEAEAGFTQQVKKWKARLNINGSKMIKGIHFQESYSPVANLGSPTRLANDID
jgi:hypothetical protein